MIKGAYTLAALALTIGIGALFGVGAGLIIKLIPGPSREDINNDQLLWDIRDETIPIYRNDEMHKDLNSNRLDSNLIDKPSKIERSPNFIQLDEINPTEYLSEKSQKSQI